MRLLIAGGGTGGHLFPALAVARALREQNVKAEVLFVGTRHGIEARVIPETEFPIRFISARGMKRTGLMNSLKGALELPLAMIQSWSILREFRPGAVLGVGGYASGPTLMTAALMRIPTAIQEQNSVMGTTNRLLSRFVNRVFISWEKTDPPTPSDKTLLTGNPVRNDLLNSGHEQTQTRETFNLLVFGGSRGARSINMAMEGSLDVLAPMKDKLRILHQTGADAATDMKKAYEKAGLDAEVREFITEMGPAYGWADLVVCRSGASSLAEITALGIPAVVVPYPYAIGDHQAKNAAVLESAGAVRVVPDEKLKNGALVAEIRGLVENRDTLDEMAQNSVKLGRPNAAEVIAKDLMSLERRRS